MLRIGVSAPYDPVHAVRAQTLPPYGVLHRVGAVAQLPDPMSVLQVPVHVERRKLSVLDFRQPQAVCCGARATCMAEDTVHGSSVDGVCVPLVDTSIPKSKHYHKGSSSFLEIHRGRVVIAWNAPAGLHTLHSARSYRYIPREHAARARCKRSHTEPLRCVPGNSPTGNRLHHGQVAGCGAQLKDTGPFP